MRSLGITSGLSTTRQPRHPLLAEGRVAEDEDGAGHVIFRANP